MEDSSVATLAILAKYQKLISKRLDCKPKHIKFYMDGAEIGSIDAEKKKEWDTDYVYNWELGEFQVMLDKKNILPQYFGTVDRHSADQLLFANYSLCISDFKLYQLPHCCAYMVSCNSRVWDRYQNNKIGTILNKLRIDLGKLFNYSAILCTDVSSNQYQKKILKNNNWKDIHTVKNKRSGNKIHLTVIDI
tara:strand:- start:61418 stop:61990 length:573 start_codon:yes stop_codon:yes gene_type:complete